MAGIGRQDLAGALPPSWPAASPAPARGGQAGRGPALVGRRDERAAIDALLEAARDGLSGTLVLRGEPGLGKTALLGYSVAQAGGLHVVRLSATEPEMTLAFAALHQLLLRLPVHPDGLPAPQRDALRQILGLQDGGPPGRFLAGLAVLTLITQAAAERPMLLAVDDAHWLDQESAEVLAFVARRLHAAPVACLFAVREPPGRTLPLDGLTSLWLRGLAGTESRELLRSLIGGPLHEPYAERVIAETGGNPLALAGVAGELAAGRLRAGFLLPGPLPVGRPLEERFLRPVRDLPAGSRALLLLAAAEPSGDRGLIWRAAARLGLDPAMAGPAEARRLAVFDPEIVLHPLVRSAVYHGSPAQERRRVHSALAAALDSRHDADLRAWHRAAAAAEPDEQIASELEQSAGRVRAQGGHAARAALLARAAELTPHDARRAERMVVSAAAELSAGVPGRARDLLNGADLRLAQPVAQARARELDGRIRFSLGAGGEAPAILLHAALAFQPHDPQRAQAALLEALEAALYAGRMATGAGIAEIARAAAEMAPAASGPQTPTGLLLAGYAAVLTGHRPAGVLALRRVIADLRAGRAREAAEPGTPLVRWLLLACRAAGELLDDEAWPALARRCVQVARQAGDLDALPLALKLLGLSELMSGHFAAAEACRAEELAVCAATGSLGALGVRAGADVPALAWRGREAEVRAGAARLAQDGAAHGRGIAITMALYALATLELGAGRYQAALAYGLDIYREDPFFHGTLALPGVIEAAARAGRQPQATAALDRFTGRARATGTPWALGLLARSRALLARDTGAEPLYREAIDYLRATRAAPDLARAHLLYGEWLRRQRRRRDARAELRSAREMLDSMGAAAFAARASGELRATGEHAQRGSGTSDALTPKETQIAQLAARGASNGEIAEQLFISASTVDYHLRKVFRKLGVSSRARLASALTQRSAAGGPTTPAG